MKKFALLFSTILFFAFASNAQPIEEGESQVNIGIGLSTYGLPFYGGIEFGVAENISVGGEFSYRKWGKYSVYSPSIITIAGIGNYHFNELFDVPPEYDIYAGLSLGYSIWSDNDRYSYSWFRGSGVYFTGQVGARYFVSDNFAINVEFGGGTYSGGKLGVTFKI